MDMEKAKLSFNQDMHDDAMAYIEMTIDSMLAYKVKTGRTARKDKEREKQLSMENYDMVPVMLGCVAGICGWTGPKERFDATHNTSASLSEEDRRQMDLLKADIEEQLPQNGDASGVATIVFGSGWRK